MPTPPYSESALGGAVDALNDWQMRNQQVAAYKQQQIQNDAAATAAERQQQWEQREQEYRMQILANQQQTRQDNLDQANKDREYQKQHDEMIQQGKADLARINSDPKYAAVFQKAATDIWTKNPQLDWTTQVLPAALALMHLGTTKADGNFGIPLNGADHTDAATHGMLNNINSGPNPGEAIPTPPPTVAGPDSSVFPTPSFGTGGLGGTNAASLQSPITPTPFGQGGLGANYGEQAIVPSIADQLPAGALPPSGDNSTPIPADVSADAVQGAVNQAPNPPPVPPPADANATPAPLPNQPLPVSAVPDVLNPQGAALLSGNLAPTAQMNLGNANPTDIIGALNPSGILQLNGGPNPPPPMAPTPPPQAPPAGGGGAPGQPPLQPTLPQTQQMLAQSQGQPMAPPVGDGTIQEGAAPVVPGQNLLPTPPPPVVAPNPQDIAGGGGLPTPGIPGAIQGMPTIQNTTGMAKTAIAQQLANVKAAQQQAQAANYQSLASSRALLDPLKAARWDAQNNALAWNEDFKGKQAAFQNASKREALTFDEGYKSALIKLQNARLNHEVSNSAQKAQQDFTSGLSSLSNKVLETSKILKSTTDQQKELAGYMSYKTNPYDPSKSKNDQDQYNMWNNLHQVIKSPGLPDTYVGDARLGVTEQQIAQLNDLKGKLQKGLELQQNNFNNALAGKPIKPIDMQSLMNGPPVSPDTTASPTRTVNRKTDAPPGVIGPDGKPILPPDAGSLAPRTRTVPVAPPRRGATGVAPVKAPPKTQPAGKTKYPGIPFQG